MNLFTYCGYFVYRIFFLLNYQIHFYIRATNLKSVTPIICISSIYNVYMYVFIYLKNIHLLIVYLILVKYYFFLKICQTFTSTLESVIRSFYFTVFFSNVIQIANSLIQVPNPARSPSFQHAWVSISYQSLKPRFVIHNLFHDVWRRLKVITQQIHPCS